MKTLALTIIAIVFIPLNAAAITNCSLEENFLKPECGGTETPAYPTPKPAPTLKVKDAFGGELPTLAPFTVQQLQVWHDDAASDGTNKAYNHYLACWHNRAWEQRICAEK